MTSRLRQLAVCLLLVVVFLLPGVLPNDPGYICGTKANGRYACPVCSPPAATPNRGAAFEANLFHFGDFLREMAAANDSFGKGTFAGGGAEDTVYGLADAGMPDCVACLKGAAAELNVTRCAASRRDMVIWYPQCLVRYGSASFFGVADTSPARRYMVPNPNNFSDPAALGKARTRLAGRMLAAAAGSPVRLAFDEEAVNSSTSETKLRGLAQCTEDLTLDQCRRNVLAGALGGVALILLGACLIVILWHKKTRGSSGIESQLQLHQQQHPQRYSYAQLKRMTGSFAHKLGQGGNGAVYTIGSLERYTIGGGDAAAGCTTSSSPTTLSWEQLLDIAVGIARGLEYLHRGCNAHIVHFDIKPHNILLDAAFRPKISDFGLAKLCPQKESTISVSIAGARGTAGYIAPEVFSRQLGASVTSKSDVYSYGMMVLEMVGARRTVANNGGSDPADSGSGTGASSIYFPECLYQDLDGFCASACGPEDAAEAVRKMVIVGLWCIRMAPSDRPSMTRVLEMLKTATEDLQLPPDRGAAVRC
ncbi:unnamed protein product [Urochloa decumbens]|uniref:non-specific serine/threonine protein kinase n=1 Tax=Urochloa decumbens TaxID=240449 RepID=A0ABC9AM76_9POAL